MKTYIINHPLIRPLTLLLMVICLSSCSLSSCSLFKLTHVNNYEDFAEVANTIGANLYFKIAKPKTPYDRVIYKDTRWRKKDAPIIINGSLFILPGVTVTIEPGAKVMLGNDALIRCQGVMVAKGTATEPILFTRQQEGEYWNAIEFNNCILKRGAGEAKVVLENCIVEYGQGLFVNSSVAEISSCVFRENISTALKFEYAAGVISGNKVYNNSTERQCETGNGAGINVYTDKTVRVENNEIYDNISVGGRDGGGGMYAFAYNEGKVTVANNTVKNNTSDRKAGGIFAYASEIIGNTVINNQSRMSGGGIYAIDSIVKNNVVTGNKSLDGGGIYSENSQLINNLVQGNAADNGAGLYHLGDGLIQYNSFTENLAVQPDQSIAITLSGNPVIEDNNIIAPAGYALKFLSHSLSPDLKAHNNFWGTTDEAVIEKLICDWLEDTQVGLISWENYRPAPVDKAYPVANPESLQTGVTAETVMSGTDTIRAVIEADTVLGASGTKRYTVTGNLLVQEGVHLDIAAGTELFLKQGATIRVRGRLTATGDPSKPVRFTGNRQQPWGLIFFESRSLDTAGQAVAAQTNNRLEHCIIENGSGLLMDGYGAEITDCTVKNHRGTGIRIKEAEATIKNCLIQDNTSDSDGGGIYVYGSQRVFINDNKITGNTAADGGGIFAYGYRCDVAIDMRNNFISGNTSLGDGGGVWTSRSAMVGNTVTGNKTEAQGGGIYASFSLIHDNQISKNTAAQGGGVFADSNSALVRNTIDGNTCREQLGGGVFLNYWGLSEDNKIFTGNIVEKNIALASAGAGGVVMNGEMSFVGNVITGNSGFQLYSQNPADAQNITAKECYWGTTDANRIDAFIYDGADDPSLVLVDYNPLAGTKAEALVKSEEFLKEYETQQNGKTDDSSAQL